MSSCHQFVHNSMSGWTHNYLVFRLWFCRRLLPFINLPAATEWGSRNGNYDLTAGITTAALHGEEEGGRRVDDCGWKYFIYNPHVGKYPKEQQSIIIWEEGNTITCNDSDYCRRRRRETMGVIKWRQELLSLLYWCLMAAAEDEEEAHHPSKTTISVQIYLLCLLHYTHPLVTSSSSFSSCSAFFHPYFLLILTSFLSSGTTESVSSEFYFNSVSRTIRYGTWTFVNK